MDTKKISEIKGELKAAAVEGLPSFIRQYGKDTRSGVVQLVSPSPTAGRTHTQPDDVDHGILAKCGGVPG